MSKPLGDTSDSSSQIARTILSDIVENFVLTEDRSSLFEPSEELDEEVIREKKLTVVARMLFENPDGKAALAELYGRAIDTPGRSEGAGFLRWGPRSNLRRPKDFSVFIESGSTLLFVSHALRKVFEGTEDHRTFVRTNNHLTAWLYLNKRYRHGLVPFLFSGALEEKYHGIFPFFVGGAPGELAAEQAAYAQCRLDMARCNLLLLAASRLSLCLGPLVGSLENAIFKHASYSACVPRLDARSPNEVHLLITADKLVAHVEDSPKGCHTLEEELAKVTDEECYPVFDLRSRKGFFEHLTPTQSPFSEHLRPEEEYTQPLKDGTQAVQIGHARFRICDTWEELLTKGGLRICVFISHRDEEREWIEREIELARRYFDGQVDLVLHDVEGGDGEEPARVFGHSMSCLVLEKAGENRG